MEAIIMIGRVIFSMLFIGSGIGHLMKPDETAAAVEARGLPNARILG